jgi:hypothetical protein
MVRSRVAFCCSLASGLALFPGQAGAGGLLKSQASSSPKADKISFQKDVQPLLGRYCYGCHGEKKKGDLDLRVYTDERSTAGARRVFEKVLKNLQAHEMPPENKPQPTPAERDLITTWVASCFFPCDCAHPDPGRVTIRRLNRAEYNNTIRDLVGADLKPADDFPADDSGYGFDNIGDVLSLSPVLLERYLTAAGKILAGTNMQSLLAMKRSGDGPSPRATPNVRAGRDQPSPPLSLRGAEGEDALEGLERARSLIKDFARRASRRPVSDEEVERLMTLFNQTRSEGETFEHSLKPALEAVLVSPHFLFRGELQSQPDNPAFICPVDEYALASRLSYFLWSSMPDEELFAQAARRTLRRNLETQVKRMLTDPKAGALVQNFAGQWLQLRNLKLADPDRKQFPDFDEALRAAMQKETELFFECILREDRSVLEFIAADYTFLNEKLARLYGIDSVTGAQFRRVTLHGDQRGGLLGQASILTVTSNPTRTSPVKRGKWVLENILGAPPPPPPPDVPKLEEDQAKLTGTLRQRMEQHRANPYCGSCHARMDPIGFGLENFDAIGVWRDQDGELPIHAAGQLVSGESFNGPAGIKAVVLQQKRDAFLRCLTEKMLTYALGRGLEYYDKCAVDQITKSLARNHYRFSSLILGVVKSTPFQMRRGEGERLAQATR